MYTSKVTFSVEAGMKALTGGGGVGRPKTVAETLRSELTCEIHCRTDRTTRHCTTVTQQTITTTGRLRPRTRGRYLYTLVGLYRWATSSWNWWSSFSCHALAAWLTI